MNAEKDQELTHIFLNNILKAFNLSVLNNKLEIIQLSRENKTFLEGQDNILIEPDLENITSYRNIETYFAEKESNEVKTMFKKELQKIAEITQILNLTDVTQEKNILFELGQNSVKGKIFNFNLEGLGIVKNFNKYNFTFTNSFVKDLYSSKIKNENQQILNDVIEKAMNSSLKEYSKLMNFNVEPKIVSNIIEEVKLSDYLKQASNIKSELLNCGANRGIRLAEDFAILIKDLTGVIKSKIALPHNQNPKIEENIANLIINKIFIEKNINAICQAKSIFR